MPATELPPNYYLDHFRCMTALISERYADILSSQDQRFLATLEKVSETAQRLLIRLYLRKGPLFLSEKLSYDEVQDTSKAIAELQAKELVISDPQVQRWQLAELLPVRQSRLLFSPDNSKIRKADLIDSLLNDDQTRTCSDWGVTDHIITPAHYESYRRLQLLYFGNESQSLTEFVLEDLGLFQYENYSIDRASRLFQSLDDANQVMAINDLALEFGAMNEARNWNDLKELAHRLQQIQLPAYLKSRGVRLINRLSYRLEQLGELNLALELFECNETPPSRERQVRILFKQANYAEAQQRFEQIMATPKSADERAFSFRFAKKIQKALNLTPYRLNRFQAEELRITLKKGHDCVEQLACDHFEHSVWLENQLPLGIFGLIFWQVIFADKQGVWHHPFQSAPTDLYQPEFVEKRKSELEQLLNHPETWQTRLIKNWRQKQGIANPFVHWQSLNENMLLETFRSLSKQQWHGIFTHLLLDLRNHRSGFPDLFQINQDGGRFIEIKGPGDKLQDNQRLWLEVFSNLGIEALVCYISYD